MARTQRNQAHKGFTLIELMVVIVIIGILSTAAVVVFSGGADDAAYSRAGAEMRAIGENAEHYKNKSEYGNVWPGSIDDLQQMIPDKQIPKEDPWGEPYQVGENDDGHFIVESAGADKQMDTNDDIYYSSYSGINDLRKENADNAGN